MPRKRTAEEQREYMRDYRAKKKTQPTAEERKAFKQGEVQAAGAIMAAPALAERDREILELREEVRRLKQELAARPRPATYIDPGPLVQSEESFRQFRPVPKQGKKK